MSDIFISYSSKDRLWVEEFSKMLMARGWSVWWDRENLFCGLFSMVIKKKLRGARCAIVVWSEQSVTSKRVQDEAAEAKKQNKYLSVKIDQSDIPNQFAQQSFQFLESWGGSVDHPELSQLLKDIQQSFIELSSNTKADPKPRWRQIHPLWLMCSPTLVVTVVVMGLMLWPISARVHIRLNVERVEFEIDATSQKNAILRGVHPSSLTIQKFTTVTFESEALAVADPSQYDENKDSFPLTAWTQLRNVGPKITLAAQDAAMHPLVTVEEHNKNGQDDILLDALAVKPQARITVEARGGKNLGLTIKLAGQDKVIVALNREFNLIANHVSFYGLSAASFRRHDEMTYRVTLPGRASWIEINPNSDGLILSPSFAHTQSSISILNGIPVAMLDFTKQDSLGERVSTISGEGAITFPDYPHVGNVSINKDNAIWLEKLGKFSITDLTLSVNRTGLLLNGEGLAKQIRIKSGQLPIEYGITAFDTLWHNPQLAVLVTVVVWVFPTSLGIFRLLKELNKK